MIGKDTNLIAFERHRSIDCFQGRVCGRTPCRAKPENVRRVVANDTEEMTCTIALGPVRPVLDSSQRPGRAAGVMPTCFVPVLRRHAHTRRLHTG